MLPTNTFLAKTLRIYKKRRRVCINRLARALPRPPGWTDNTLNQLYIKITPRHGQEVARDSSIALIHVFPLTFAGFLGRFSTSPKRMLMHGKHVRSLLLHKSIQKVDFRAVFRCIILPLFCFDFLHHPTKMISTNMYDILATGKSVNNCSIMAGN